MPIPLHSSEAEPTVAETRYPALTKQAAGKVNGVHTDVMSITFADKILVTITQEGRLAQWVRILTMDKLKLGRMWFTHLFS